MASLKDDVWPNPKDHQHNRKRNYLKQVNLGLHLFPVEVNQHLDALEWEQRYVNVFIVHCHDKSKASIRLNVKARQVKEEVVVLLVRAFFNVHLPFHQCGGRPWSHCDSSIINSHTRVRNFINQFFLDLARHANGFFQAAINEFSHTWYLKCDTIDNRINNHLPVT